MIIRRRHTANFTTIGNTLFDDEALGADELGILVYLLSRPHNWEVRRPALMRRFDLGPVTTKRIINNLMRSGWCQAKKVRLPSGRFCILYDICDEPSKKLSDAEIREALSLVSGEASEDQAAHEMPENGANIDDSPPPSQPVLDSQRVADEGWPIRDITNTDLPKDESTQSSERELARTREKHVLNLGKFKIRWPTAASDDQTKIDNAWFELSFEEGEGALAGIAPFLAKLKADRRTTVPAGWRYLREKRWTLLAQDAAKPISTGFERNSDEAVAIAILHDIAGAEEFFRRVIRKTDGTVIYYKPVTPRLLALAQAGPKDAWPVLDHRQAASWEHLLREAVTVQVRKHLRAGDRAPWPWPPSADGKLYTDSTGPPESLMTEDDYAALK